MIKIKLCVDHLLQTTYLEGLFISPSATNCQVVEVSGQICFTSDPPQAINSVYEAPVIDVFVHSDCDPCTVSVDNNCTTAAVLKDSEQLSHCFDKPLNLLKIFVSHVRGRIENERDVRGIMTLGEL